MAVNIHQIKNYIRHFFTAKRKGHDVHSPFVYTLCEEVFYNRNAFYDFKELSIYRKALQNDNTELEIEDFGAGSKTFKSSRRRVGEIAARGISSQHQSELLYKLVAFLRPATIVELGTSLGLNTIYLSKANKSAKVYTIEGSSTLAQFARRNGERQQVKNCEYINGKFDEVLPALLLQLDKIDLFYIDGNHTYEATLQYFKMGLEKKQKNSVFIFDDIYWSEGMTRAWEEIKRDTAVKLSIDTFHFGLIFFKEEMKEKIDVKILI